MTEGTGERATGTPNTTYDLSSVLFHALEGGASYDTYIEDAEREGDQELADFFRRVRDEDAGRADEAQLLLAERTPILGRTEATAASTEGAAAVSSRTEPSSPPPGAAEELPPTRAGEASTPTERPSSPGSGRSGDFAGTEPVREEAPPPRTAGMEEGTLPRIEETTTRRPEQDLSSERERAGERSEEERGEDKGLIERARDTLLGEEERERRGADRQDRR